MVYCLFVFAIIELGLRRLVRFGVIKNPTDACLAQQPWVDCITSTTGSRVKDHHILELLDGRGFSARTGLRQMERAFAIMW
jgi:hypothetical protein